MMNVNIGKTGETIEKEKIYICMSMHPLHFYNIFHWQ